MEPANFPAQHTESRNGINQAKLSLTVSQVIQYFAATLAKPGNYPRIVRQYLDFCLNNGYGIDLISIKLYALDKSPNRISPVRKFLMFYQIQGQPTIIQDPPEFKRILPAANELILGFINDSTTLRGDESKETYVKSLNSFFSYIAAEQEMDRAASFTGSTVDRFVLEMKARGLSAFTVNTRLSAIKQLAEWVIKNRSKIELNTEQVDALREIAYVRGLTVERKFYKDSLEKDERDCLLIAIDEPDVRAMIALMVYGGLRTVEITRLRIGDVDFNRKQLWVLGKGKHTKKDVVLFQPCSDAIRAYLESNKQWPPTGNLTNQPLFPDLKTHHIRYRVKKYFGIVDLWRPRLSAHSLRHTSGQLLLEDGVDPVYVQRHLRHDMFETTQFYIKKKTDKEYYVKVTENDQ